MIYNKHDLFVLRWPRDNLRNWFAKSCSIICVILLLKYRNKMALNKTQVPVFYLLSTLISLNSNTVVKGKLAHNFSENIFCAKLSDFHL